MPQVKIRIEKGAETAGDGKELQEQAEKQFNQKVAVVSVFANQAMNSMKQIINFSASHTGEWTGNYIKQANLQGALETVGDIASFGTAIATSIATYNPIPIILQTLSYGLKTGLNLYEDYRQQIQAKHDSDFLLARSGNATTNGSRGTEN